MRAFGESSLNFELLGWIDHPEDRGRITHELLLEIDKRFRQEGIVIPFPQRDVHVHYLQGKTFSEPNLDDGRADEQDEAPKTKKKSDQDGSD